MKKSRLVVGVLAASIMLASGPARAGLPVVLLPSPASVPVWFKVVGFGVAFCAAGLISTALAKSIQQKKELTPQEAASCGFSWFFKPKP